MGRFNLIDSPWISVVYSGDGINKLISLRTLFQEADLIERLAGDTKTQDFAIFRVILAVLNTVYSRFDVDGNSYTQIKIDDKFRQISEIDDDDINDYLNNLDMTWDTLWKQNSFSPIVGEYLDKWHDHFYLFHDKYPFFQVLEEDIVGEKINKTKASQIQGKTFNRTLSESGNKTALFSPRYEAKSNKSVLDADEVARWLITYQGYTGLADKAMFGKEKYKASKGWLFDLGGIYIEGNSFFETLMMNFVLIHPEERYVKNAQEPCWEHTSEHMISKSFRNNRPNNLAQLYTACSRAIYIDPEIDLGEAFSCQIVKLPDLDHQDQFLEPMTTWQYNKQGPNSEKYTPRKHRFDESLWRSFGLIAMPSSDESNQRRPGIIRWLDHKKEIVGDTEITIIAVSMQDDGNATSWLPVDEICDVLRINDYVLTDIKNDHWVPRIEDAVEQTKSIVHKTYWSFLSDIAEIRNIKENTRLNYINDEIGALYFEIDVPFRTWLSGIYPGDSKDSKIIEWRENLYTLVRKQADSLFANATSRDLKGIEIDGQVKNIATSYNSFMYFLNRELKSN